MHSFALAAPRSPLNKQRVFERAWREAKAASEQLEDLESDQFVAYDTLETARASGEKYLKAEQDAYTKITGSVIAAAGILAYQRVQLKRAACRFAGQKETVESIEFDFDNEIISMALQPSGREGKTTLCLVTRDETTGLWKAYALQKESVTG